MFNNWNPQQSYYYQQPRFQPAVPQPIMPQQQQIMQPKPIAELPIVSILFATEQEANSYLPQANTRVLLINKDKGEAYLKSADALGQTYIEPYTFKAKVMATKQEPIEKKPVKKEKVDYITKAEFETSISKLAKDLAELSERINKTEDTVDE